MNIIETHFVMDIRKEMGMTIETIKKAHVLYNGTVMLEHHNGKKVVYELITERHFKELKLNTLK